MRIKFLSITFLIIASLALSGCSHATLKSPCGPTASLDEHPCGHIPANIAAFSETKKVLS